MQTTKTTRSMLKKLFGVVAAAAFVSVPMVSVIAPTEAAPRIRDTDRDRSDRDRNDRDRDNRTLEGVVTVDRAGRNFTLRQNNGERIQVRSDDREPQRLSTGDRVRVTGYFRRNQRNLFIAESIQILTNQNDANSRTFTGRVTSIKSNEDFDVLIDGKTYNVTTRSRLPRRLNRGDIVRIFGRRSGSNDIKNATVVIIDNNNGNNNGNFGTFEGRVSDVDSNSRFNLVVNGVTFDVTTSSSLPRRLNRGDRVRVYGRRVGGNDITNASVVILNNR